MVTRKLHHPILHSLLCNKTAEPTSLVDSCETAIYKHNHFPPATMQLVHSWVNVIALLVLSLMSDPAVGTVLYLCGLYAEGDVNTKMADSIQFHFFFKLFTFLYTSVYFKIRLARHPY